MQDQLVAFVEDLKSNDRIRSYDEAAVKQTVVLKLLSLLGWDVFNADEVRPEHSVGPRKVDYSLRIEGADKVFIEVKRAGEALEDHQEQLLSYSFAQGVRIAVLTNAVAWWFYLPLCEGSWDQRKAYSVDILQQASVDVAAKFVDFLSRQNVGDKTAIEHMEAVHKGQQKAMAVKETLPKAWNKLIEEPDDLLVDLISDTTEKLCGFKAESEQVLEFLARHKDRLAIGEELKPMVSAPAWPAPARRTKPHLVYTGKTVTSFVFRGSRHEVRSWKDLLLQVCSILRAARPSEFEQVCLSLRGRKRPYFSRNPGDLRVSARLQNTSIFVETNVSANQIVKISHKLLQGFGYSPSDLQIESH